MCFLSSLSLTEWMLILTTIFTGGLLWIAWLAYKKLLVQEASKKQLEIVNELITDLVYAGIKIRQRNIVGSSVVPFSDTWNIFTFSKIELVSQNENLEVNLSIRIQDTELSRAFKHLGNPLLPPKIADSINVLLKIAFFELVAEDQEKKPHYILGPDVGLIKGEVNVSQYKILGNFNGWLQACKNIQSSIIAWYDAKGVKEINHLALAVKKE